MVLKKVCILYTTEAADERTRVHSGERRIKKTKKKHNKQQAHISKSKHNK